MKLNKFNHIAFLILPFFAFTQAIAGELNTSCTAENNNYWEKESNILIGLLREKNYIKPGPISFRQRCLDYFGIDIKRAEIDYIECINGSTGCYDIFVKQEFISTIGEFVFYYPSDPEVQTVKRVNERLRRKDNQFTQQLVAYNKLIFNDDYSFNSFFLDNESVDYLWEVVFKFDYEKNEILYVAALPYIGVNEIGMLTNRSLLLYNNKQRGYKKKLLNDLYLMKGVDAIERALVSTNNNWWKLKGLDYDLNYQIGAKRPIDQSLLDKALIHLLKLRSHHQSDGTSLIESERSAYNYIIQFFDKDKDPEERLKLNNYYDMGLEVRPEEKRVVSITHNDLLVNHYVTQSADGYVNLRKAPGTQAEVISKLPNKTNLIKMKVDGNWYYVQLMDSDIKGFVHNSQLLYLH